MYVGRQVQGEGRSERECQVGGSFRWGQQRGPHWEMAFEGRRGGSEPSVFELEHCGLRKEQATKSSGWYVVNWRGLGQEHDELLWERGDSGLDQGENRGDAKEWSDLDIFWWWQDSLWETACNVILCLATVRMVMSFTEMVQTIWEKVLGRRFQSLGESRKFWTFLMIF